MNKLTIAALACAAALPVPACAATFLFTITGGATGSGTIEATPFSATAATVTSISGIINGVAITGLRPVNNFVNDNVLLFGNDVKLTDGGIGLFQGSTRTDLFYNYGINSYRIFTNTGGVSSIDFQLQDAAVPEPATWAMMIAGFGLIGGTLRRRTSVRIAASA